MNWVVIIFAIFFIPIFFLYCLQRGREKRIGTFKVFLIMIFATPFYWIFYCGVVV